MTYCREETIGFGVVEGVGIRQHQFGLWLVILRKTLLQRDRCEHGTVKVPFGEVGKRLGIGNLALAAVACGTGSYGNRNMSHPHVLLIDAVGHPEVGVAGHTIAGQRMTVPALAVGSAMTCKGGKDAAHILRTIRLVVASIAHLRNVAMHEVQRLVVETVGRKADGEWPTELRRIIYGGIHAVGETLSPDLGIRIDEAGSAVNEGVPRHAAVLRVTGERVLPQRDDGFAIGQGIIVESLVFLVEWQMRILAIALFDELHPVKRRRKNLLDSLAELLVLRLGVEGEVGVRSVPTVVVIEKIDGAERAIGQHFAHHAADAVAIVGVVLLVEANAIVSDSQQTRTGFGRRNIPAHTLMHHGLESFAAELVGELFHGAHLVERAVGIINLAGAVEDVGGQRVFGEKDFGSSPIVTVLGSLHPGDARWDVFAQRIAEEVHPEPALPISQHRLMVVGPALRIFGRIEHSFLCRANSCAHWCF